MKACALGVGSLQIALSRMLHICPPLWGRWDWGAPLSVSCVPQSRSGKEGLWNLQSQLASFCTLVSDGASVPGPWVLSAGENSWSYAS